MEASARTAWYPQRACRARRTGTASTRILSLHRSRQLFSVPTDGQVSGRARLERSKGITEGEAKT